MNKILLVLAVLVCAANSFGQHVVKVKVTDAETKEPLPNVSIVSRAFENASPTKSNGETAILLPAGKFLLTCRVRTKRSGDYGSIYRFTITSRAGTYGGGRGRSHHSIHPKHPYNTGYTHQGRIYSR